MSLTYESKDDRVTEVQKDGKRIGVITDHNGSVGYRIFGAPVGGSAHTVEEAKKAIESHFN